MSPEAVRSVCQAIYRQFPELAGKKPTVRTQRVVGGSKTQFALTFRGQGRTADGHNLSRTIQVTADADGRILKIAVSHT